MSLQLQARNLACERDGRWLFGALDLEIQGGDILRVEGANGSGKTTLLKILSAQSLDYQGSLLWRGEPLRRVRRDFLSHLLYIGHASALKPALSALENLSWHAALAGQPSTEAERVAALATLGLSGFEDLPVGQLSAGQQRRVALARLVLVRRWLWMLDEPFTALDRDGIQALEALLSSHVRQGGSVVLTTHQSLRVEVPVRRLRLGEEGVNVTT